MRTTLSLSITLLLALGIASCGGSSDSGSGGSGSAGDEELAGESDGFDMEGFEDDGDPTVEHGSASARELIGIHPPPTPWHDMSREEREYYMVAAILPVAAEDFRGYDAERFANMTCAGCHGDDGQDRGYEMPSTSLPRLPAPGTPEWTAMQARPAYTFMSEVVTPTVAAQLGMPTFDPATGTGFGCFECHQRSTH